MSEPITFSALLKRYRLAAGLSQEALAARAEISARAVSDMERGRRRAPHPGTLERLAAALGLPAEQRALFLGVARPETQPTTELSANSYMSSLLVPPTALLGREPECARVRGLIRDERVRLLTVTGPGGVGKTRLCHELARDLTPDFADGALFVDLTSVRDSSLLLGVVAQAMDLREEAGVMVREQVIAYLATRHVLFVLDGAEHIAEAAYWLAEVLAHCPSVVLLATSRVPLRLPGESILALEPLPLDDAVALFRARAVSVRPEGDYSGHEVVTLCEQLDRLPLAIELAAVHVRTVPVAQLAQQLDQRLKLLRGGKRDIPLRQRAMEDAIAWSYDLLTASARRLFRQLSVFVGGCTMEATHAVCWEQPPSLADALLALADLLDASLVHVDTVGTQTRFRMLEVSRDYALARLHEAGEEEACRRRHALWFAEFATDSSALNPGLSSGQLVPELPNLRSALAWAELNEEAAIGMRLLGFAWALFMAGHIEEATQWMERMLDLDARVRKKQQLAAPSPLRVERLGGFARALLNQGRIEQATARATESLRLAEQIQDETGITNAYLTLGLIAQLTGRLDQAAHAFTESCIFAGRAGRRDLRTRALVQLGELCRQRGDTARAESLFAEGLTEARAGRETWDEAIITTLLGHLAHQQRQYDVAGQRYHESLVLLRPFHNPTFIAWCMEGLAATLCATGYPAVAVRLCAAAAAQRAEARTPLPEAEREQFERVVAAARADLGEGLFDIAWAEGTALSLDDVVAEALKER